MTLNECVLHLNRKRRTSVGVCLPKQRERRLNLHSVDSLGQMQIGGEEKSNYEHWINLVDRVKGEREEEVKLLTGGDMLVRPRGETT